MKVLCLETDRGFQKTIQQEAQKLGIDIVFSSNQQDIQQLLNNPNVKACIFDSKIEDQSSYQNHLESLVVLERLPDIEKLKNIKSRYGVKYVTEKKAKPVDLRYLLLKLCNLSNDEEPQCDWLNEIPESLMNDFYKLSYERLKIVQDLIKQIQESPSESLYEELSHIVHKIAGSAGLYGRGLASELCKEMEILLTNKLYEKAELDRFYQRLFLYLQ